MSRSFTKAEARERILRYIKGIAEYWATQPDMTELRRCEGTAFTILSTLDGSSADFPAMDLVLHPHPDDKKYRKSIGRKWYRSGMVLNDNVDLHEQFAQLEKK